MLLLAQHISRKRAGRACQGKTLLMERHSNGTRTRAPSWLDKLPGAQSRIYAAGYSGPTYRADDALRYAGENAIDNLVSSLRAHVQAVLRKLGAHSRLEAVAEAARLGLVTLESWTRDRVGPPRGGSGPTPERS